MENILYHGSDKRFGEIRKSQYEVDASQIPEENIRYVDERQIAITEMERITPLNVQELKAREILKYHTILDRDGNELFSEFREKDLYQENAKFR